MGRGDAGRGAINYEVQSEMMNIDCYDTNYQSPDKDAYAELIRQQNCQNN